MYKIRPDKGRKGIGREQKTQGTVLVGDDRVSLRTDEDKATLLSKSLKMAARR